MNTLSIILITIICILVLIIFLITFVANKAKKGNSHRCNYKNDSWINSKLQDINVGRGEQVYVGNLHYEVNERQLHDFFIRYGHIQDIRIVRNTHTGRSKGYAFITYIHHDEMKKSLSANGTDFLGRPMVVRVAKPRTPNS